MNLFINAVSSSGMLILFDKNQTIIAEQTIEIKWNESSKLTWILDSFLWENKLDYSDLDNIVVVHWPGSFTGVRAICLIVNTIAFSTNARLTPMSYFDLFSHYPILKQSSKRDMFMAPLSPSDSSPLVRGSDSVWVLSNEDVVVYLKENGIETVYGEAPMWWEGQIVEKIDYCDIITHIKLDNLKQISPLYLKKPNIC